MYKFSIARMRTRFIRTSKQPRGADDRSDFSEKDHAALKRGNRLLRATLRIIGTLGMYRTLWFLEKPYSSLMWKIPALRRRTARNACEITLDFCSFVGMSQMRQSSTFHVACVRGAGSVHFLDVVTLN